MEELKLAEEQGGGGGGAAPMGLTEALEVEPSEADAVLMDAVGDREGFRWFNSVSYEWENNGYWEAMGVYSTLLQVG